MIQIVNTRPEHIEQLAAHQQRCFPTLNPDDWMRAEMFAAQLAIYPEGQHVALDGDLVVGQSSTFRTTKAVAFAPHTYREITAHNYFTGHDPHGEWLYGSDMSVHPDYRGRKIATMLYTTRKELVRRLGIRGIVAGGALPGYHQYSAHMSVEEYIAAVSAGRLTDPTLTAQLKNGFRVHAVLRNYVDGGELVNDDATLLVWEA
ncbi:MAG: GNAT family N-acetyltransferase [Oscillochloris sp.]|nr:GNAT family N-acetyltransferase [Oscillochloris sp.]